MIKPLIKGLIKKIIYKSRIALINPFLDREVTWKKTIKFLIETRKDLAQQGFKRAKGCFAEFGVQNGESFGVIWEIIHKMDPNNEVFVPEVHAFDSFEGLPASSEISDMHSFVDEGSFNSLGSDVFVKRMKELNLPIENLKIVKGYYSDTLSTEDSDLIPCKNVIFANIDCDYYSSTIEVLDFLKQYLKDGAFLYFDDIGYYNYNPHKGQLKAIDEFNKKNQNCGISRFEGFDGYGRLYVFWEMNLQEKSTEALL